MTHICVSKQTIIGSDNGLSPGRRQTIIWTNDGILLIWPLRTNFSEFLIKIHTFSFKKMHLKMSSGKCRPSCLSLNVLRFRVPVLYSTGPGLVCCFGLNLTQKVLLKTLDKSSLNFWLNSEIWVQLEKALHPWICSASCACWCSVFMVPGHQQAQCWLH